MSVLAVARRVRAYGGHFLLLMVLTLVTAVLVTGVPRLAERLAGQGLREQLAEVPGQGRDLLYRRTPEIQPPGTAGWTAAHRGPLDDLAAGMPPVVRDVIGERWYAADTGFARLKGPELTRDKGLFDLALRTTTGLAEAATLVEGRWAGQGTRREAAVEIALAEPVARALGVRAGSRLRAALYRPDGSEYGAAPVVVVGVFRPRDPADGVWDGLPSALRLTPPVGDGQPFQLVGLTDAVGLDDRAADGWAAGVSYRYRVDPDRLAPGRLDALIAGLSQVDRERPAELHFSQGVDIPLRQYADALAAARTLLTVIATGVLATLAGLTALAAGLAVRRRRDEYVLLRARGGSAFGVVRRGLAESALVVPAAAGVGWLLGGLLPTDPLAGGTPGAALRLALAAALLATVALPVAVLAAQRGGVGGRRDLLRLRGGAGRLTVEVTLVGLAALAAFLLRRRGLTLGGQVDPLLVSVPVLLAVAAALLALRAYPWPLRLASRLAARARGAVAFLGTARAGRAGVAAPLVVVVLAIATAAFCGVVAVGISDGRDRAVTRTVPADALVAGDRFAPDTAAALAGLPGVRAVTPVLAQPGQRLYADADGRPAGAGEAYVLLVEPAGFADVARRSGLDVAVPGTLRGDRASALPALVSPDFAAALAEAELADRAGRRPGWVDVQGNKLPFRLAGTTARFPLVPAEITRFVVLPWPDLPADGPYPLAPTGFLLAAGDRPVDPAALARVAEEGQTRYQTDGTVTGGKRPLPPRVTTWAAERERLGGSGVNGLLVFGFAVGAAGGALLGLLALAFAVLAGARGRGQVLSRLRTMGLSRRQWQGLLLIELAPLVVVSVLTGAVVGALLPVLLNPVLGLSAFTGGVPVTVRFEPGLVAGVLGLAVLALAFAVAVEAVNNRRLRLGEVLRLGEES
ncbi:FtsX-like permease family protein [Micromonospora coxensis]|uniref:Putative ABC transport system permease protein n=1 Tax=Micromonospora coxensis TaxID=356852 RepID=A0A1C5JM52_9ACTN|nr:FtsX-like permease family protein [Micromonospora coxensis]SCG71640.1 putative ABC transport system permease protein [Micromonospora coxensis]